MSGRAALRQIQAQKALKISCLDISPSDKVYFIQCFLVFEKSFGNSAFAIDVSVCNSANASSRAIELSAFLIANSGNNAFLLCVFWIDIEFMQP